MLRHGFLRFGLGFILGGMSVVVHLSARLAWHDRGWDGSICDAPKLNSSCIVHEHIRDNRDDELENRWAGKHLSSLDFLPPCSRDPGAYSPIGFRIVHRDPVEWRALSPVEEDLPPYSFCTSPYGRMLSKEREGWENRARVQLEALSDFFGALKIGESLVFFYVDHGNPVVEDEGRIIVGIGRISDIGPQLYFNKDGSATENPVWSRRITHDFPSQGVRLPYQEYVRRGLDPRRIVCRAPDSARSTLQYVAEHATNDVAVSIVERVINSVEVVRDDGQVPGDWTQRLRWLDAVLEQLWKGRGRYPGLGSVLSHLGFSQGIAFHRRVLMPMLDQGIDVRDHIFGLLDGKSKSDLPQYQTDLATARREWETLHESRRTLLRKLSLFELSPAQVSRVCNSTKRRDAGIEATEIEIVANPYLLAEQDRGDSNSDPIDFETIDHGMIPSGETATTNSEEEPISPNDKIRIRALLRKLLSRALEDGDTFLPVPELLRRSAQALPTSRECVPEPERLLHDRAFHEESLSFWPGSSDTDSLSAVALRSVRQMETEVADRIRNLVVRKYESSGLDWDALLAGVLGGELETQSEWEEKLRREKTTALEKAFSSRLSVVTGRAGTGKTTLVRALLTGIERKEGKKPCLLLAPTGKARVRLQEKAGKDAQTIHQLLSSLGWLSGNRFGLRQSGGKQRGAHTVVVDEASMIPIDLLATLFRAIDFNEVKRLVLIGDPNQLPPIGPGRPFLDIIAWLQKNGQTDSVCRLEERARFEDRESQALRLSDAFTRESVSSNDDEILSQVARKEVGGDLEVHYWTTIEDLQDLLFACLPPVLGFDTTDAIGSFNASLGLNRDGTVLADNWQILSPLRGQAFGILETNRWVQSKYRAGLMYRARSQGPKPFGDQELVFGDKVIQLVNSRRRAREGDSPRDGYVANGEVGLITNTNKKYDYFQVMFSSQPSLAYDYHRSSEDLHNLELAYAITVHKSQGSDFGYVFLIVPQKAATLSRELLYTGLTRFKRKLVLLIEKDITPLLLCRRGEQSATLLRNTNLFELASRPETIDLPHQERLIHRTMTGVMVRSKSEVIVANVLTRLNLTYKYEDPLRSLANQDDFRLPDFTVMYEGETFYWEHLGLLNVKSYREEWERKEDWYRTNGYFDRLIASRDGPDGSIDSREIERVAKETILHNGQ